MYIRGGRPNVGLLFLIWIGKMWVNKSPMKNKLEYFGAFKNQFLLTQFNGEQLHSMR